MNNPQISIVVPVYNSDKYLSRCLDSILCQTNKDWEAILVDDGSTDQSGKMCDEYAQKDKRFKVIHKKNGGVSSARQFGTDVAVGEYIIHVDSDDWIESDMLECLYSQARKGYDIVVADFYINSDEKQKYRSQLDVRNATELLIAILKGVNIGSLWNKLIRRSLFSQSFFPLELFYSEDVYILAQIILEKSPSVINLHKAFYHYMQINTSITHIKSKKHIDNMLLFTNKMDVLLSQYNWAYQDVMVIRKQKLYIVLLNQRVIPLQNIIKMFRKLDASNIKHQFFIKDYKRNVNRFYIMCIRFLFLNYFRRT